MSIFRKKKKAVFILEDNNITVAELEFLKSKIEKFLESNDSALLFSLPEGVKLTIVSL